MDGRFLIFLAIMDDRTNRMQPWMAAF